MAYDLSVVSAECDLSNLVNVVDGISESAKLSIAKMLQMLISTAGGESKSHAAVVCDVVRKLMADGYVPSTADAPFCLLDVGRITELLTEWVETLPRVRPFVAVKCNMHPLFPTILAALGTGFDCATKEEIRQILSLGVPPDSIVFSNACKLESDIEYAAEMGVHLTTFDSKEEVQKIKLLDSKAKLLLRIVADDEGATIPLSSKYGARMDEVEGLLATATEAGLSVVGVAFHIGSGAVNHRSFVSAIADARCIFDLSKKILGSKSQMHILDIGGGFCSSGPEEDEGRSTGGGIPLKIAAPLINQSLENFFPLEVMQGLTIVAEPGRYFACSPFTLVTRVFGKRVRGDVREYWINDGAHGSFTMILLPHKTCVPPPIPLACLSNPNNLACEGLPLFHSNVFGPTCSSLDVLLKDSLLPELEIGDLLAFSHMGAYTHCLATQFNGFSVAHIRSFCFMKKTHKTN